MYDQFYGFTGRPFQITPDPNFYFESSTHRKAMSYLGYGLAQGEGVIVITGETGTGKTTLVGHLLKTVDAERLNAVKLVATQVEGDDLLALTAEQFGLDFYGEEPHQMLKGIEIYLRSQARAGRRTLLLVDEAQNLSVPALEQLTLLSGLHLGEHPLIQIFMLGHPEFRQTLSQSPSLATLRGRVIATHHLDPMEPEEIEPYIFHRLGKVGWTGVPSISPDAFEQLYIHSEGFPRRLNALVTKVLMFAALDELPRITGAHVRDVIAELDTEHAPNALASPPVPPLPSLTLVPDWVEEAAASVHGPSGEPAASASEMAELREQVAKLEARVADQDVALRRVIDLLINWVEKPEGIDEAANHPAKIWAA